MSLPVVLPYGIVSIYGVGFATYTNGVIQPDGMLYGKVDAVSPNAIFNAVVGEYSYFKEEDVNCRLAYTPDNTSYTLVPDDKLVCRLVILP